MLTSTEVFSFHGNLPGISGSILPRHARRTSEKMSAAVKFRRLLEVSYCWLNLIFDATCRDSVSS